MSFAFDSLLLRRSTRLLSVSLSAALFVGCVGAPDDDTEEESTGEASSELSGFLSYIHPSIANPTTTDMVGLTNIAPLSSWTCFLSGVTGNLDVGGEWQLDEHSVAEVKANGSSHVLLAHGGGYTNQDNQLVWEHNPVRARAACLPYTLNRKSATWQSDQPNNGVGLPSKLGDLHVNDLRQCYLSGLWGVGGSWNGSGSFARITKITTPDATHSTTGFYVEANLPSAADASHARVMGACVDVPSGSVITANTVTGPVTNLAITSGAGVKACALTSITGAFNQNDFNNGVQIIPPDADNVWRITVSAGKTARWKCVQ